MEPEFFRLKRDHRPSTPTPDRGLDLSERAPRIYDHRCTKCGGFMTSDSAYGCTPEKCADEPVRNPYPLRENRWLRT
jgi:hypothetical protein